MFTSFSPLSQSYDELLFNVYILRLSYICVICKYKMEWKLVLKRLSIKEFHVSFDNLSNFFIWEKFRIISLKNHYSLSVILLFRYTCVYLHVHTCIMYVWRITICRVTIVTQIDCLIYHSTLLNTVTIRVFYSTTANVFSRETRYMGNNLRTLCSEYVN